MTGYVVVFVKPGSEYQTMGFKSGDVIVAMDKLQFDQPVPPETFKRIKERKYKTLKVDHCLQMDGQK